MDEELLRDEIKMKPLDRKLFTKEIKKYADDHKLFEEALGGIGMGYKYHKKFANRGMATHESFHNHIKAVSDLEKVIGHSKHASVIWSKFKVQGDDTDEDDGA